MTICRERGNIFKQSASRSFTSEISGLRKQYGMRGWRNWQTRTFEVRVVYPWGFESPPSHQKPVHIVCWFFFLCEGGDLEQGGGIYAASKATVQQRRPQPAAEVGRSCCSSGQQDARPAQGPQQTLGAATCSGSDRCQWRKQGAEAGAVFWFFKAPQGRCGKNSKHNPCSTPPKSPEVFCAAVCDRLEP